MLEDLINQPPFTCYLEWRAEKGIPWDEALNPCLTGTQVRLALRMAEGKQAGALNQRTALPPLLPFGMDPDQHFHLAILRAQHPLPTEALPVLDDDLRFAGECCAKWRGDLRARRNQAIGALKELKSRLATTTAVLIQHQSEAIRQVTQGRDLALLTLLLVLTSWGDTSYPMGLITGLPAVGYAPHYNIFPPQLAEKLSQGDVLTGWEEHNASILRSLKPGRNDQFLLSQSQADADRGFCTYPMKRADMLSTLKNQPHRLIPRCVITQLRQAAHYWQCRRGWTERPIIGLQQTSVVFTFASSTTHCCYTSLPHTWRVSTSTSEWRLGIWRRGLARRLSSFPNGQARILRLCSSLVAWSMGWASIPTLLGLALWTPTCCYVFQ